MQVADFDYALPEALIAQHPAAERTQSRLLHLGGSGRRIADLQFTQLPDLLSPGDVLVLNDTRVIKARLAGRKQSGGAAEVFIDRVTGTHEALALIRASHPPPTGSMIIVGDGTALEVIGRTNELYRIRFHDANVDDVLEQYGAVPLPPYIRHAPDHADAERYQTVYAREHGAVAAPTAGLHFDSGMLERIEARGVKISTVTLHVGSGTFQPVRVDRLEDHHMHSERYRVPQATVDAIGAAKAAGGRVLAAGTTALRALESAARDGTLRAVDAETDLFIYPGFRFHVVDRLLTNFHLPKSTLLMLVAAFAGTENVLRAYQHAIANKYRFFSYGDASLIEAYQ